MRFLGDRQSGESRKMKNAILLGLLAWASAFAVVAQQAVITGFHGNGVLTWSNRLSNAVFSVQWASTVTGPWQDSWSLLRPLPGTAGATKTVDVPMFYRVAANTNKTILLAEDFADGSDRRWTRRSGQWSVAAGAYTGIVAAPTWDACAMAEPACWTNYILRARIMTAATNNDFELIFHAQDTNHFMRFTVAGEDGNTCRITQDAFMEGGFEAVAEYASVVQKPAIVPGVWYTLTVITHERNAFAFVNDDLVAYAMDLPYAGGFVGFMTDEPTITCKEILVTSL
jgi:hypothetical protein